MDISKIHSLARRFANLPGANRTEQAAEGSAYNSGYEAFLVASRLPRVIRNVTFNDAATSPKESSTTQMDTTADSSSTPSKRKTIAKRNVPTRVKVLNAIKTLNEPDGSSLKKIKKFVYANYDVNQRRIDYYIRRYLRSAYATGELIQKNRKPFNINRKFRIAPK